MAEFDIGEHCSVESCKQLDFLPIHCDLCELVYCKLHASYDAHLCTAFGRSSTDETTRPPPPGGSTTWYKCEFAGCTSTEVVEIRCELCGANFCLVHRHGADHRCPSIVPRPESLPKTAQLVREILDSRPKEPAKKATMNPKSAAMAAKIALIKLKQKATGDALIPDNDRVFFNIVLPLGSRPTSRPMFFSRRWYVGKVIDRVASSAGLVNNNNQTTSGSSLRLFDGKSGLPCPSGETLEQLLDSVATVERSVVLHNGGTIIVEYVDDTTEQLAVDLYV